MTQLASRLSWALKQCRSAAQATICRRSMKQQSVFLELPIDLLLSIFDFLPLAAKVILSQTCKDLRRILQARCSWAIRNARMGERLECLEMLEQLLPGLRLCYPCQTLHSHEYILSTISWRPEIYLDNRSLCPAIGLSSWKHPVLGDCILPFRHLRTGAESMELMIDHQQYLPKVFPKYLSIMEDFHKMTLRFTLKSQLNQGRYYKTLGSSETPEEDSRRKCSLPLLSASALTWAVGRQPLRGTKLWRQASFEGMRGLFLVVNTLVVQVVPVLHVQPTLRLPYSTVVAGYSYRYTRTLVQVTTNWTHTGPGISRVQVTAPSGIAPLTISMGLYGVCGALTFQGAVIWTSGP